MWLLYELNSFKSNQTNQCNTILEKLEDPQLVNKFLALYETRSFISFFTTISLYPYSHPDQCSPRIASCSLKPRLNMFIPSTPRCSKLSLSLGFRLQNLASTSPLYVLHGQPISLILFYHLKNTWTFWGIQVITLGIMQSFPFSSTSCLLSRNIFLRTIFSNILRLNKRINIVSLFCIIASEFQSLLWLGNMSLLEYFINVYECLDCICRSV